MGPLYGTYSRFPILKIARQKLFGPRIELPFINILMKLFSILFEVTVPDAEYGYWIHPSGQMMVVDQHHGHEAIAANYLAYLDQFSTIEPDYEDDSFWTMKGIKVGMVRVIADFDHLEFEWDLSKKTPSKRAMHSIESIIKAYHNPGLKSIMINNQQFQKVQDAFAHLKSLQN